ncbi:HNH endonuclease [Lentibacillus sp. JNUCC-1]|uniref:HNH endonuclease n=1 Tax=Lentibacillus sp. JNUCC-1 TaxID=2654513 RepID=UPI0022B2451E|nr:HNH endonuclease signature motif containing protein [Lentibacillus sp. JNUCC-1]
MFLRRNPLCVHCTDSGMTVPATEVDHIVPHRGDRDLFWDPNNHQGLCKSCHSKKTRKGL